MPPPAPGVLGKCPACKSMFQEARGAFKCTVCRYNFHGECLGFGIISEDQRAVFRSLPSAIVCEKCRGLPEQLAVQVTNLTEQLKKRARAPSNEPGQSNRTRQDTLQNTIIELRAQGEKDRLTINELSAKCAKLQRDFTSLQLLRTENANESAAIDVDDQQALAGKDLASLITAAMQPFIEQVRAIQTQLNAVNQKLARPTPNAPPPTFAPAIRARSTNRRFTSVVRGGLNTPSQPTQAANRGPTKKQLASQPLRKEDLSRTLAQVMANSAMPLTNRFTILSNIENEEENKLFMTELTSSPEWSACGQVINVSRRSPKCIAIEAIDDKVADCMIQKITEKHGNKVAITKPVANRLPQIKITGCTPAAISEEQISRSNPWIVNPVRIVRHYDVTTNRSVYRNFIVEMSLDDHTAAVAAGKLLIGLQRLNCYEYVDSIQCKRCWRFGHLSHGCRFAATCRICGKGSHLDAACDATKDTCANCARYNKANPAQQISTAHRVTDDKCPQRTSRIEYLKDFFQQQQKPRRGGRVAEATLQGTLP